MYSALSVVTLLIGISISCGAPADVAGQWTKCAAWDNSGRAWNIANGTANAQQCAALAQRCIGNQFHHATFYEPPVVINAPYTLCTAR
jgi:hypothetical protein